MVGARALESGMPPSLGDLSSVPQRAVCWVVAPCERRSMLRRRGPYLAWTWDSMQGISYGPTTRVLS